MVQTRARPQLLSAQLCCTGDRQTLREAIREEAAEKEDLPYPYETSVGVETYKGGRSIGTALCTVELPSGGIHGCR